MSSSLTVCRLVYGGRWFRDGLEGREAVWYIVDLGLGFWKGGVVDGCWFLGLLMSGEEFGFRRVNYRYSGSVMK